MKGASTNPDGLSVLDQPNSYIGKVVPRPNLERLMQGRGLYVSDLELPRMVHVVFLRSPHAHAKIIGIDAAKARRMPDVIAIVTGKELATVITPWVGVLSHLKGLKSAPQHAVAIDRVCWQGEAVAAVVATSRAVAEDAAEIVLVERGQADPDRQAALQLGEQVGGLGQMERARRDEENMIRLDGAVFGGDRRPLQQRQ